MPLEQAGVDVTVKAFFVESKVGKTGLTVTVDVYNPAGTKVVTGASATEVGDGLYTYTVAGSSLPTTEGEWVAIFKTATTSVDVQHIPTIWVIGRTAADVANVETDTQDIQSRLPAALVSGRMSSDAVAISGSTAAADAVEANIGNLDDAITDAVAAPAAALTAYDPPTRTEATSDKDAILAILGTPADTDLATDIATIDGNVDTLIGRITSTLFSGITSLAQWLGLIAGKQTGNSTARTELRATGAGSGTYDETTDSLEANRDNIGTAGVGLTEAGGTGDQLTEVTVDTDAIASAVATALGGSATISIVSPVGVAGNLTIEQGDDYTGTDLDITVPGTHDLTGATVSFRSKHLNKSMTVQSSGGSTQVVRLLLSSSETAALPTGQTPYQIDAVLSGGSTKTIARAILNVKGDL